MEGVTRESLKPLLDVQRVDSGSDRLTIRRGNLPEQKELDDFSGRRAEVGATHGERLTVLDGIVREQHKIEADVTQIDDKLTHEQERLYSGSVQNPKELGNISAELDALRRRKAHLEDQELEVMERREELESEVGVLAATLAEIDANVADATMRRDAATVEIDAALKAFAAERAGLVPLLHPEVVSLYDTVRAKQGGIGAGALEKGTCRACGLPLSPMAMNEIRQSDEPIIRCENCRRLLVVG